MLVILDHLAKRMPNLIDPFSIFVLTRHKNDTILFAMIAFSKSRLAACFGLLAVLAGTAFSQKASLAGHGLAHRDFFYAGEAKIHHMYVVEKGEIAWHYHNPDSRGEISDALLLSGGNILFAHQFGITEITRDQQTVWSIEAPQGTEIHTVQPIGREHIVYVQNGLPAKMIVMHIPTKKIIREFELETREEGSVHGQFRNARLTRYGTYMVAHMNLGKVIEYDSRGNTLWSVDIPGPWSVQPLDNENVLVVSNTGFVREINRCKETVWEVNLRENPLFNVTSPQVAYRTADGNTIVNNWFNQWGRTPLDRENPPLQAVEISPDKHLVWELCSWNDPYDLGPSTIIQPLDEPVDRDKLYFGDIK